MKTVLLITEKVTEKVLKNGFHQSPDPKEIVTDTELLRAIKVVAVLLPTTTSINPGLNLFI